MGRWGIRGLETRVGRECSISRGGPDCTVEVYVSEESEEGVTVLQQGATPRVRAAKSSHSWSSEERESCELNLEKVQFGEGKL